MVVIFFAMRMNLQILLPQGLVDELVCCDAVMNQAIRENKNALNVAPSCSHSRLLVVDVKAVFGDHHSFKLDHVHTLEDQTVVPIDVRIEHMCGAINFMQLPTPPPSVPFFGCFFSLHMLSSITGILASQCRLP